MYLYNSVATLTDNIVTDNLAEHGGALSLEFSSGTLTENTIVGNTAIHFGGGVYLAYSDARLTNNTISDNSAHDQGGGLCLFRASSSTLSNNTITRNSAKQGGGLHLYESSPWLINNTITANSGYDGGGLYLRLSNSTLTNNIIENNLANRYGGGAHLVGSSATLTNNTITGNSADYGGGLHLAGSSATLTNNNVTGNSAGQQGGGLYLSRPSNPTLTNNTIASNSGGGLYNDYSSPALLLITNCILWANTGFGYDLSGARATYSDIGTGNIDGEGNINADPMFVDSGAGDYHLQDGSPCIDAGSNSAADLPDTDKDDNPRIVGAAVDMGAYEWQRPSVIAVEIDIKPGSYPNAINLGSYGIIPVAILSSAEFDATTVDPDTVELAGSGVAVRGKGNKSMAHGEDVNGDGLVDLVVQVSTENLDPGSFQDGYAVLTGKTYDGVPIQGEDEIIIVPPE